MTASGAKRATKVKKKNETAKKAKKKAATAKKAKKKAETAKKVKAATKAAREAAAKAAKSPFEPESPRPSPYRRNSTGAPELRLSVVLFADILGYGELLGRAEKSEDHGQAVLNDLDAALTSAHGLLLGGAVDGDGLFKANFFTDNVVIGWPIRDVGEFELGYMMLQAAAFQLEMAMRGYFIRGGLEVGHIYVDEKMVFGPVLAEAHRLETKVAVHPRVVLGKVAYGYLREHVGYYGSAAASPQNTAVLCESDGELFVNYLLGDDWDDTEDMGPTVRPRLKRHRAQVCQALEESRFSNRRVWEKYVWTASYHNFVVREWLGGDSDLLIDEEDFRPVQLRLAEVLDA